MPNAAWQCKECGRTEVYEWSTPQECPPDRIMTGHEDRRSQGKVCLHALDRKWSPVGIRTEFGASPGRWIGGK